MGVGLKEAKHEIDAHYNLLKAEYPDRFQKQSAGCMAILVIGGLPLAFFISLVT